MSCTGRRKAVPRQNLLHSQSGRLGNGPSAALRTFRENQRSTPANLRVWTWMALYSYGQSINQGETVGAFGGHGGKHAWNNISEPLMSGLFMTFQLRGRDPASAEIGWLLG